MYILANELAVSQDVEVINTRIIALHGYATLLSGSF